MKLTPAGPAKKRHAAALLVVTCLALAVVPAARPLPLGDDPLPSWNVGPAKSAILEFVKKVTNSGGADFVPVAERIATFDNDGTLWSEQPVYFQFAFVLDRVKQLAPEHPEWKTQQPFKAVIEGDAQALGEAGE